MTEYRDLIGRDLHEGDAVAYPTGSGSSKYMCVGRIEKLEGGWIDKRRYEGRDSNNDAIYTSYKSFKWKARIQPLHFNDYRTTKLYGYDENGKYTLLKDNIPPKQVIITRVDNLVKVDI